MCARCRIETRDNALLRCSFTVDVHSEKRIIITEVKLSKIMLIKCSLNVTKHNFTFLNI